MIKLQKQNKQFFTVTVLPETINTVDSLAKLTSMSRGTIIDLACSTISIDQINTLAKDLRTKELSNRTKPSKRRK